jgi:hypothetical protein
MPWMRPQEVQSDNPIYEPNPRPQLHKGVEGLFLLQKTNQSEKYPEKENEREESG